MLAELHRSVPVQGTPGRSHLAMPHRSIFDPEQALQGRLTPTSTTKKVQCPLHLPSLAWGASGLGCKGLILLSVQEHVAPRTQVAGGSVTLCMCVLTASVSAPYSH